MTKQNPTERLELTDIPHGHGLSFKKGVADGLLRSRGHKKTIHPTHKATYERGHALGVMLKDKIAKVVKA
jgi:hypothetical protein